MVQAHLTSQDSINLRPINYAIVVPYANLNAQTNYKHQHLVGHINILSLWLVLLLISDFNIQFASTVFCFVFMHVFFLMI